MPTLNPKQERFCEEFMADLNAAQAAVRAGYVASSAARLMEHPDVKDRIAALKGERSERVAVEADDVIRGLFREANAGDINEPNGARIRAWELIGKHLGMFVDRKHISIRPIEEMTEAELVILAGEANE